MVVAQPELWDNDAMVEAMGRKEAKHQYGKIDIGTIDPGKCQMDHGWDNWQIAFANKLNATLGATKVPLDYIKHQKVPYVTRTMYVYTVTRKNLVRISLHLCYTPKKIVRSSYYAVTCLCNAHHDTYCMGGCPPVCHMSVKDIAT
jgi:hypothetical protein